LERRDKRQFRKLTKMFEELDEDIIKLKLIWKYVLGGTCDCCRVMPAPKEDKYYK
jgi:hypothetical protein